MMRYDEVLIVLVWVLFGVGSLSVDLILEVGIELVVVERVKLVVFL